MALFGNSRKDGETSCPKVPSIKVMKVRGVVANANTSAVHFEICLLLYTARAHVLLQEKQLMRYECTLYSVFVLVSDENTGLAYGVL